MQIDILREMTQHLAGSAAQRHPAAAERSFGEMLKTAEERPRRRELEEPQADRAEARERIDRRDDRTEQRADTARGSASAQTQETATSDAARAPAVAQTQETATSSAPDRPADPPGGLEQPANSPESGGSEDGGAASADETAAKAKESTSGAAQELLAATETAAQETPQERMEAAAGTAASAPPSAAAASVSPAQNIASDAAALPAPFQRLMDRMAGMGEELTADLDALLQRLHGKFATIPAHLGAAKGNPLLAIWQGAGGQPQSPAVLAHAFLGKNAQQTTSAGPQPSDPAGTGEALAAQFRVASPASAAAPPLPPKPGPGAGFGASLGDAGGAGNLAGNSGNAAAGSAQSGDAAQSSAGKAAAAPARAAAAVATPAAQVAVSITRGIRDGQSQISLRMDPPELGRVDVRLELAHDGRTNAVVSADRQETLDLLQRDSRFLERALQDAGIEADEQSLSFRLNDDPQDASSQEQQAASGTSEQGGDPVEDAGARPASASAGRSDHALDISI